MEAHLYAVFQTHLFIFVILEECPKSKKVNFRLCDSLEVNVSLFLHSSIAYHGLSIYDLVVCHCCGANACVCLCANEGFCLDLEFGVVICIRCIYVKGEL